MTEPAQPTRSQRSDEARLPADTRAYLDQPSLQPLWAAARKRLEGNGLRPAGALRTSLGEDGIAQLAGLLGRRVRPGATIQLADLDAALRGSAAGAGLVSVLTELTGPLTDRQANRQDGLAARATAAAQLEEALAHAGLGGATWVPQFIDGVRAAGLLTKASDAAATAIRDTGAVLTDLTTSGALADRGPTDLGTSTRNAVDAPTWGLAELASRRTGDAHGLDRGRITATLVTRALAAALKVDPPRTARDTRELWARVGVLTDEVSGTALVWGLRPPGDDPWSVMLRTRADLRLVTHLTVHELRRVGHAPLTEPGVLVAVCENPQVLQAAAGADVSRPLVCTSGNPATAGWQLLDRLLQRSARLRYHGDFDWNGVAIAGRIIARGAEPWRFNADDYLAAVAAAPDDARLSLGGRPVDTPWDNDLAEDMSRLGVAVHEETLLDLLVSDLQ